jgi:photosystem II stability/assembly factor-like uncharacterized protein
MDSDRLLRRRSAVAGAALASMLSASWVIGQDDPAFRAPRHRSQSGAAAVAADPPRQPTPLSHPRPVPRTIDREAGDWTSIGPEGVEVLKIAVAKADQRATGDPVVLFVATKDSGVLRSADGGENWTSANGGLPAGPLTSLALHQRRIPFGEPGTMYLTTLYAGSVSDGIFRSTDHGSNWTSINDALTGLEIYDLVTDETGTVFAATSTGLFRSPDSGNTWVTLPLGPAGAIAIDPKTRSRLFAGAEKDLLQSSDGGANWTSESLLGAVGVGIHAIGIDPFDPSTVFAVGWPILPSPIGIPPATLIGWVTRNSGADWVHDDAIAGVTDFAFPEPNTALASRSYTGVLQSNNQGLTWVMISGGLPAGPVRDLALDPVSPGIVYAATGSGVYLDDIHPQSGPGRNPRPSNP